MKAILTKAATVAALTLTLAAVTAGTASARPISEIRGECPGQFVTDYFNAGGTRLLVGYTCFYKDVGGSQYKDHYNPTGDFQSTWEKKGGKWVRFE